jgi:N utilization substance protein B
VAQRTPSRKQARRDAVFLLYQREVTPLSLEELVQGHRLREGYPPDDFTIAAVSGVIERSDALDAELGAHSRDWPVARIAPLERSILRLALWELRHTGTPPQVAIDEAVRLTKRYSTDDSSRFVNGVLGGVVGDAGRAAPGDGADEERSDDIDHEAWGDEVEEEVSGDEGREKGMDDE